MKGLGKDDKRQITCNVSSAASGELLPFQCIFQGGTTAVVPKNSEAKAAVAKGWHLTHSANHWSNQQTMREFVDKVWFHGTQRNVRTWGATRHLSTISG
jgi:hypothetical protein